MDKPRSSLFRAISDLESPLEELEDREDTETGSRYGKSVYEVKELTAYPAVEVRQGWITMAPAIKELERAIVGRQFQHGGHEVLRWCFDNIRVETDRAGNRLFSKGKARERIDGAVACAIAVSLAQHGEAGGSIYDLDVSDEEFFV